MSHLRQPAAVEAIGKFDPAAALARISRWLPAQGPIKDFIHHNTLHAFQDRPFHSAIASASALYGAHPYLKLSEYQAAYRAGRICDSAIARALDRLAVPADERGAWVARLKDPRGEELPPPGIARCGIRVAWRRDFGVDLDALVQSTLFRLLSPFLDQGISIWRMPHATADFWTAARRLVEESWLPVPPLSDPECRELLRLPPEQAVLRCLSRLVGEEACFEQYLLEMLFSHPGWSGMVQQIERTPSSLLVPRKITLLQMAAVELLCELGWLRRKLGRAPRPLQPPAAPWDWARPPIGSPTLERRRLWQDAFEWTYYEKVLGELETHGCETATSPPPASIQAFFCLDDRACSLRRHLETVYPEVATYGTAGFFGIDFVFQAAGSSHHAQHCPVVITPKHLVREIPKGGSDVSRPRLGQLFGFRRPPALFQLRRESNTLFRGWLLTQVVGLWSLLRLALDVFRPGSRLLTEGKLGRITGNTELELLRVTDETTAEGLWVGYSIEEMAERVWGVLTSSGSTDRFSRLVVFVAHGASSANNPHFAAYDCGACSGKPGAPNARAFAWMANHPQVREALHSRGVVLPPDCFFLGAIQDTTRDEVEYFDLDKLPATHGPLFQKFESAMQKALRANAKERCRRFELVDPNLTDEQALRHVRERSTSIFEPRPEFNHATNAVCIIGRREFTRGMFLDRRAFLNSYNPAQDPAGEMLAGILAAAIPVCAGINLEYFFSRVDNTVYGAGSKLPHNVVSLLGVSNGVEGDLRTGLPAQMVEIHDPVRLLVVVEQEPAIALRAAAVRAEVFEWIENEWVHFVSFSPSEKRAYVFREGKFEPVFSAPGASS